MSDGRVIIDTGLDTKGFEKGLKDLSGQAEKSSKGMFGAIAGGSLAAAGLTTALGVVKNSIGDAFGRLDTIRQFGKVMNVITGDASITDEAFKKIDETVTGTAYTLDSGAQAVQRFVTSGMSVDKATEQFAIWGDAVAFYGNGSTEQLTNVTDAIAKMTSKGKVDMEQLNRITESGVPAVQIFAEATGMSMEEAQTALSKGEVKSKEFIDVLKQAMTDGTESFAGIAGAAKNTEGSFAASFANLKTAVTRGLAGLITAMDDALKGAGLGGFTGIIESAKKKIDAAFKSLQSGAKMLSPVIKAVVNLTKTFGFAIKPILAAVAVNKLFANQTRGASDLVKKFGTAIKEQGLRTQYSNALMKRAAVGTATYQTSVAAAGVSTKTYTVAQRASAVATVTASTATRAASVATRAFSAAIAANPIGLIITGVTLLVSALGPLIKSFKEASPEYKAQQEYNRIVSEGKEKIKELSDAQKELDNSYKDSGTNIQVETDFVLKEVSALDDLMKKTDKTASDKRKIADIVQELNDKYPDLHLNYDKEKDKLNKNTEALKNYVLEQKNKMYNDAIMESQKGVAKNIIDTTMAMDEAKKALGEAETAAAAANQAVADFWANPVPDYEGGRGILENLENEAGIADAKVKGCKETVAGFQTKLNELQATQADYSGLETSNQTLADSFRILGEQGIQVPTALVDSINQGKYGVITATEDIAAIISSTQYVDTQKLGADGAKVNETIAAGIASNKILPANALNEAKALIDFSKAKDKVTGDGKAVIDRITSEINDGKTAPSDGLKEVEAVMELSDLSESVAGKGNIVVQKIYDDMLAGKDKPTEALNAAKTVMQGQDFNAWGWKMGEPIAQGMGSGILSTARKIMPGIMQQVASETVTTGKRAIDSNSPSKLFARKIGEPIAQGIGKGMVDETKKQSDGNAKSVAKTLSSTLGNAIKEKFQGFTSLFKDLGEDKKDKKGKKINTTSTDFVAALKATRNHAVKFAKDINKLRRKGVSKSIIDDILGLGAEDGYKTTQKLLKGLTKAKVKEMNSLASQMAAPSPKTISKKINTPIAQGVSMGVVKGTEEQIGKAERVAQALAGAMGNAFKGNLSGISSSFSSLFKDIEGTSTKKTRALVNKLKTSTKQMGDLNKKIENAKKKLADAKNARDSYKESVKSVFSNYSNITGVKTRRSSTSTDFVAGLAKKRDQAVKFAKDIDTLRQKGVAESIITDIMSLGVDEGYKTTQKLLKGLTSAKVTEMNSLVSQIDQQGVTLANALGNDFYQAGVNAAKGVVEGLESEKASLEKQMRHLARSLVNELKKALKIKSPSRVARDEIGKMFGAGLAEGVEESSVDAEKSSADMAAGVVSAAKDGLDDLSDADLKASISAADIDMAETANQLRSQVMAQLSTPPIGAAAEMLGSVAASSEGGTLSLELQQADVVMEGQKLGKLLARHLDVPLAKIANAKGR